jgi:hypothetical protein
VKARRVNRKPGLRQCSAVLITAAILPLWAGAVYAAVAPAGIVIDLTGLDYSWGDDLEVYDYARFAPSGPIRIVVEPAQWDRFKPVLGATDLRTDRDASIREVNEMLMPP